MNTDTHLDFISVFIIIGVIQGFFLSFFFIKKSSVSINANLYQGLLILILSICILEQWLNLTGYITHVLVVTNSTEWLNLIIGPLLYLYVKRSIDPSDSKKDWIHFILAFLYFRRRSDIIPRLHLTMHLKKLQEKHPRNSGNQQICK